MPVQVAELIHQVLREELSELPDPDVHRAAAKVVRLVGLCFAIYERKAKEVLLGSKVATNDELKSLVKQHFPTIEQER